MAVTFDVIIVGGGIAGLWLAARLKREGYNLIVLEQDKLGGLQTLASQGMIHGGQKYNIGGTVTDQGAAIARMPARWKECFCGRGELDLSSVRFLSDTQVMWPAGSMVSSMTVFAAAKLVNTGTKRLKPEEFPAVLAEMRERRTFKGSVYELPEKVLDVKSLVQSLARESGDAIFAGKVQEIFPEGTIRVSETLMQARIIIFAAGTGNELPFEKLGIQKMTQRRPLRQIMVKPLTHAIYGHGIAGQPKPRVTITSHPLASGEYVWYLGGDIAEKGARMNNGEALQFAFKEMKTMFPLIDWNTKEWASWQGDRAEPFDEKNRLPAGPCVYERDALLVAWPAKLTFAPLLADNILGLLRAKGIRPQNNTGLPSLPRAEIGAYPWEAVTWQKLA
jgi:glycine/D-amino acid oxidase-like deaminating enzyme